MAKGYSPEQIVRKLREAEDKLVGGAKVPEVCREFRHLRGYVPPLEKAIR